ncbi:hypothetical protein ACE1OG_16920 [Aeromonas hydrophila]|nr:hypothetical protein [Aeromonas hydrophila]ELB2792214.1 hypothetical protein [Aeromonas hydrophila]MCZ4333717.1 hypothetical protein [Aeromonas hydrophila]
MDDEKFEADHQFADQKLIGCATGRQTEWEEGDSFAALDWQGLQLW